MLVFLICLEFICLLLSCDRIVLLDYANKRSFVNENLVMYRYGSDFLSIGFMGFSTPNSFNLKLLNLSVSCHLIEGLSLEVIFNLFEIIAIE